MDQPPYFKGVYTIIKLWYCHASAIPPKVSRADLAKVSGDYSALYQFEYLPPPWGVQSLSTLYYSI